MVMVAVDVTVEATGDNVSVMVEVLVTVAMEVTVGVTGVNVLVAVIMAVTVCASLLGQVPMADDTFRYCSMLKFFTKGMFSI